MQLLSGGHYCNNVRRTVLHMQSCPPGRCCIMQLCPPGHICICSCVAPRSCFFFTSLVHVMNDMGNVRPLGIRCNHKIREYSCCIRRFSACTIATHAHTCTVMYMSTGRFLHSPGHDCIRESVRSGQYCMADTIASDTDSYCKQ